jgi:hypothetical protein
MALWDTADLLARMKRHAYRPAGVDLETSDTDWYALATEAQSKWIEMLATHVPESQYGPQTVLITKDGGATFQFPEPFTAAWKATTAYTVGQQVYDSNDNIQTCTTAGTSGGAAPAWNTAVGGTTNDGGVLVWTNIGSRFIFPLGDVEVRAAPSGRLLRPGPDWDPACDYVPAGPIIRFPGARQRNYFGGPVGRYCPPARAIDVNTQPMLNPPNARILIVYHACMLWARRGGLRDPEPFKEDLLQAWAGDPQVPGDVGILGALKNQYLFAGAASFPAGSSIDNWWRFIDDGSGYSAQVP